MTPSRSMFESDDEGEGESGGQEEPMNGRMVVGVDGSETARKAVRWAAREAKLSGMKLELVSAWEIPI
jgi:Universal stress protein family